MKLVCCKDSLQFSAIMIKDRAVKLLHWQSVLLFVPGTYRAQEKQIFRESTSFFWSQRYHACWCWEQEWWVPDCSRQQGGLIVYSGSLLLYTLYHNQKHTASPAGYFTQTSPWQQFTYCERSEQLTTAVAKNIGSLAHKHPTFSCP